MCMGDLSALHPFVQAQLEIDIEMHEYGLSI
jgi:hypothetical protein